MRSEELLKVGDSWLMDERWRPAFERAQETLAVVGLSLLVPGCWLLARFVRNSGSVRYRLFHRSSRHERWVLVGWFVLDYLPEWKRHKETPLETHGREVWIGGKRLDIEWKYKARVWIDEDGLPWPLPEQVWQQLATTGALSGAIYPADGNI